ncbi:uncharacterized protein LOC126899465 [Daktulosphaira vitifoliae]|uniref:uncharacterized protein LOC126899465 n=1 Tax=Daktulosphaira vitifoliae TaxID=58002 RepID=UPI0021AB0508|nr:uncharacterized protein LOC126899465 [Daktulosphaira vitifoliae]
MIYEKLFFVALIICLPEFSKPFVIEEIKNDDITQDFVLMLNQIESIVSPILFPEKALSLFDEEEVDALLNKTTKIPGSIIEKVNLFSNITKAEKLSIEKKLKVKEKYENKKNSLQCINTLILNAIIWNIKNALLINEMPNPDKLEIFEKYKMYLSRMLSILYYGHIRANRWQTDLYTKLLNIADTERNEIIMKIKFINQDFLWKEINEDLIKCEVRNFIPKHQTRLTKDEFYSFYKVFDIIEQLYNNEEMNRGYIYEKMFSMENMMLYFIQDQYKVIFGRMATGEIDLQNNMNDMEKLKIYINTIYKKNEWIIEHPRIKLKYHLMFQEIVFTHILRYILLHMQQFLITFSTWTAINCYNECSSIQMSIYQYRNLWHLIVEPLKDAIKLLGFKDTLLNAILMLFENNSLNQSKYYTLYYQAKFLHRRCLNGLFVRIGKSEYQLYYDKPYDDLDEFTIQRNISKFIYYIKEVKTLLKPINNSLFFIRFLYQDVLHKYTYTFLPYIINYYTSDDIFVL